LHGFQLSAPDLLTAEVISRTVDILLYIVEDVGQKGEGGLDIAEKNYYKGVDHHAGRFWYRIDGVNIYTLEVFKRLPRFGSRYIGRYGAVHPIYAVVVRTVAALLFVPVPEVVEIEFNMEDNFPE